MAGIAGIARDNVRSEVNQMLDKISFRGSDGRWIVETKYATLGVICTECDQQFASYLQK